MTEINIATYFPPTVNWGNPNATKRALCLHPLGGCGQMMYNIGEGLSARGYYVTAPELLGHGLAADHKPTNHTIKTFAESLLPFLSATAPYDAVIASSFSALVALALIPHLKGTFHVVLIDPPLESSKEMVGFIEQVAKKEKESGRTVEQDIEQSHYLVEDALWRFVGRRLTRDETWTGILRDNSPWSFTDILPGPSPNLKLTIILADPETAIPGWAAVVTPAEVVEIKRKHPHIITTVVKGASHGILREIPHRDAIIEIAAGERT